MSKEFQKKILVTGFEPFNRFRINPSQEVVEFLENEKFDSCDMQTTILPVNTKTVWEAINRVIIDFDPDVILCLGFAVKRSKISLEKVAINLLDFEIEDNERNKLEDTRISDVSPDAYFSNFPLKAMREKLDAENIPAAISYSAGAFLCNQIFYLVMDYIYRSDDCILGGFVHLPPVPELNLLKKYSGNCMPLELQFKAVKLICDALTKTSLS